MIKKLAFILTKSDTFLGALVFIAQALKLKIAYRLGWGLSQINEAQTLRYYAFLINGKKVHLQMRTQDIPTFFEVFYEEVYKIPFENIPPNAVIVDAGSHIGFTSVYYACMLGDKARFFCVEPSQHNYPILLRNLRNIRFATSYNHVLSSKNSLVGFQDNGIGVNHKISLENLNRTIESLTLDEFLNLRDIDKIDILKLDIEGAEKEIFEAGGSFLSKTQRIILEVHGDFTETIFSDLIQKEGFIYDKKALPFAYKR